MRCGSLVISTDDRDCVTRDIVSDDVVRAKGRGHADRDTLPLPSDRRFANRLRAVRVLRDASPPFTAAEIAEAMGLSERQVWRLLSRLGGYKARLMGRV